MSIAAVRTQNQSRGRPRSRFYGIAARIADRMTGDVSDGFLDAIRRLEQRIDEAELRSAVASGNADLIDQAARLDEVLSERDAARLEVALRRTSTAVGTAGAEVLTDVTGVEVRFNAADPRATMAGREQGATLVRRVREESREAIRVVVSTAQAQGLTTAQQATAIREVVALPANWAEAPMRFRSELESGRLNSRRLLHDPLLPPGQRRAMERRVRAEIRERLDAGEVTEEWLGQQQESYARNLRNRRAQTIARTETLQAAHTGQHEGWRQAMDQDVLPRDARRTWVVTPDDRLEHWMVPGMNEGGRGMDELFQTPEGAVLNPPSRPNCRCGVGLMMPGRRGVL